MGPAWLVSLPIQKRWCEIRKPVIGLAVFLHFTFGLSCFLEPPSIFLRIPGLPQILDWYERHDFSQTWRMFAPPSQTIDEIGYSLEFENGWTQILYLNEYLKEEGAGRFILPRGYLRLANHLRHPVFKKSRLEEEPFYFYYFQQLGAFFCFGDGAIPGLKAIRFYSVTSGVPPFFEKDSHGHPLPKAEDYNKVEALYERRCNDK
jgi:hypothetical protein